MSADAQRHELIAGVESHERELEQALDDLRRALHRPFAVGDHLGEHVSEHPLPWLVSSLLAGLWLGSR